MRVVITNPERIPHAAATWHRLSCACRGDVANCAPYQAWFGSNTYGDPADAPAAFTESSPASTVPDEEHTREAS